MADQLNLTIAGRLSYPTFTYKEALARNEKSEYKKDDLDQVAPDFNLLLEQSQLEKVQRFILDQFLPDLKVQRDKQSRLKKMTDKHIDMIAKKVEGGEYDSLAPYLMLKPVPEKTAELAPEAVAMIKINGNKKTDILLKAIVRDEDELAVPDADILKFPVIRPIEETVHELYPGCITTATLNMYGYMSGANPGIGCGASAAVFKADAERFGGGAAVDEDAMFADD